MRLLALALAALLAQAPTPGKERWGAGAESLPSPPKKNLPPPGSGPLSPALALGKPASQVK